MPDGTMDDRCDAREIARRLWLGDLDPMARTYYPSDEVYGLTGDALVFERSAV